MNPVNIINSENPCNIIASIPHGSSKITLEMKQSMRKGVVLPNNDWFLNDLYDFLHELNITVVSANYSRYVIDVNRNIENKFIQGKYTKSLVYYNTTFDRKIYDKPLEMEVIEERIKNIYNPYHFSLKRELEKVLKLKNKVYLIDLHSFFEQSKADIILGTREGKTCSKEFLRVVYDAFTFHGFNVKVDEKGLRGGYIVSHYSSMKNVEAIQIEIRYTAYIENRYFGEEEVKNVDNNLFYSTKRRLYNVLCYIRNKLEN
ncbi:N-formylglutamate amidohydrolase [Clostridium ljungdahlii]|uniref:N-formylglutamate amidohydrolase n=1 Tax=Clostridium ljungdahlii TaxID=1538 RepID=A0A168M1I3_9CLOT|nr:N-formylglutamate amidohydrolase [Clostridium ljungdahlii]OAA83983.1 N-formylglutamate amidohydrolase [Clostridium ljungdahlii]